MNYIFTYVPTAIRIRSDIKLPYGLNDYVAEDRIEVVLNVIDDFSLRSTNPPYNFEHCFFGSWGADELYYEPTLGCPISAKMLVKGLLSNRIEIQLNKTYCRLFRRKIGGVEPPNKQLVNIIMAKLLEWNLALIHASAFGSGDEGIVIIAPTRTGKTLTVVQAVQRGYDFIAEDTSITDGENIYPIYSVSSPGFIHNLEPQRKSATFQMRLIDLINNKLPILSFVLSPPSSNQSLPTPPPVKEAKIKYLFFLSRGKRGIVEMDKKEALKQLLVLTRLEFNCFGNKVLLAYSYLNSTLDLTELMAKEHEVLSHLVDNHPCFMCTAEDPRQYIDLIEEVK